MTKSPKKLPLSKKHIIWSSLILTLVFTYAGVEESLWESFTDLEFNINFVINFIQIYFLIRLTYYLHFTKKWMLWRSVLCTLAAFYLLQLLQVAIIDYEADDYTELYSITLPFGSFCILAFNLYYHLIRDKDQSTTIKDDTSQPLWLDTVSGRVKINEKDIQYAFLSDAYLEIHTENGLLKVFYSLRQLEDLLSDKTAFFRMNKQYLGQKSSIVSFKTLTDGRLEITLTNDQKCIISKNKASSFKKWLNEA